MPSKHVPVWSRLEPVDPKKPLRLTDREAAPPSSVPSDAKLKKLAEEQSERIADLQKVFYADGRFALLVVLQGRDASGKDGTIRHVFRGVNPQGCQVTSFIAPSVMEQRHDFLWRVHARVPARGMIGVFNRSHYEDVLVERVRGSLPRRECTSRLAQINDFERMLAENGTVILKFFLHVSRGEQRHRFERRLEDDSKNWKFAVGDLDDRAKWPEYTAAYRDLLRTCSTEWAPWYVVPADDKKLRDVLVARAIADTLASLRLRYPPADPALRTIEIT